MMKLIIFILSIVLIYSNEDVSYTFKEEFQLDEIIKIRSEQSIDFAFGTYQNSMNTDSKITQKYLGKKNGFILLEKTVNNMMSTNITFGEMSVNNEMGRLIGIPYIVYIDSTGYVKDVETEYRQFEEQVRSMEMDMGGMNNYIYPYGPTAVNIKEGDSWTWNEDSIIFFPGDGEFENYMKCDQTFTLDKVKQKGDKSIAYISVAYTIAVDQMLYQQGGKFFEGYMVGAGKGKMRFDLVNNNRMLDKQAILMRWDVTFEDKHLVETMTLNNKSKWKK